MTVYGFEKLGERCDWSFYHADFQRHSPDNLVYIIRPKLSSDKPLFDALEIERYRTESGVDDSTKTKVNSATSGLCVQSESDIENTMKLLQSPEFILNSLSETGNYLSASSLHQTHSHGLITF